MMVSNGNLTGLVERLVASGHVDRRTSKSDRRSQVIRLTQLGREEFRAMAEQHEGWVASIFAGLTRKERDDLMRLLAKTKMSARNAMEGRP
jgi:DNA-binding MarR family transcriptional regulator